MQNIIIGNHAEQKAYDFLTKQGLKNLTRNYRCRMGEIDLIMKEGANLIFIEVRFRKSSDYGQSFETVTRSKQQRIIKASLHFLKKYPKFQRANCRFDVIGVDFKGKITWIKNAFTVQY